MGIIVAALAYQVGKKTSKKHEHDQSSGDRTPQQHYHPPGYIASSAPYDPASQAHLGSPCEPCASYAPTYASEPACSQSPTHDRFSAARDMTPNGRASEIAGRMRGVA